MKLSKNIKLIFTVCMFCVSNLYASAFDINSVFGKIGDAVDSEVIGNMIQGVFTTSKIEITDIAGEWTSAGSAVNFKSENFLNKAGGVAGAAMIEKKIDPYFSKFGLTGSVMTIQEDGQFELKIKKITLKGVITKQNDGNFNFAFQSIGNKKIGDLTAYITKSPNSMNVMFDASKLQTLINTIASFTGNNLAKTASDLINSYDGICIGFKMNKTGNVKISSKNQTIISTQQQNTTKSSKATDFLKGILTK